MQLHRTTGRPDWQDVPPSRQNSWQKLAAGSAGVLTPGNIITFIGFAAVVYGLVKLTDHMYWTCLFTLVLGRLCDVLDGWVANRTGTKSPLGEFLDVVADKLTILGVVIAFWVAHIVPLWLLLAMALPHVIISVLTAAAYLRKQPLHPSRFGKYNMAAVWVIVPGFVLAYALHMSSSWLMTKLEVLAVINVATGLFVAYEYARGRD